ncbi:hypothetical protein RAC89_12490 [Paenibacillus sp. GD4]|uniref:hypothetical protein n=1 Tax=Paenibacillus sp. GD4 TaxID=3068890 RepID=UPI0027967F8B|nr:hypothetical protein [Paenibacillus sp. GD4]MDQ1911264.1 hypothetical protein [Paenibacillus sp. GD4]
MIKVSIPKWVMIAITIFFGLTSISIADAPSNNTPGSVEDPVITKSYFDQNISIKVADALNKLSVTEDKVKQILAAELKSAPIPGQVTSEGNISTYSSLNIIRLESGQSLYGGSGTEFIVRTGKTVVFSNDESGIADVTVGKDIVAGQAVELNHMLIVPREGRGIKPDVKNNQEIYVMVRGSYLLTNADGSKVSP